MLLLKLTTENLSDGLVYTALGFGVVMIVLLLITFILYLFSYAVVKIEVKKNESKQEKAEAPKLPEVAVEPVAVAQPTAVDDTELVAVITAAIAASLNTTTDKLVVRSIRKVNSWKKESIRQKNNGLY